MITAQFVDKKRHRNRAKYKIRYHIIFMTKYRKHLIDSHIEDLIKKSCSRAKDMSKDFEIEMIEVDSQLKDRVHLLIKATPQVSPYEIIHKLKQITTYDIWHTDDATTSYMRKFYKKQHHLWTKGYFCSSIGDTCTETVRQYIESQS